MNKKTSTSILVIAVIAAVLSTAFGLSSVTTSYATQQSKASSEITNNNEEQHDSNSHPPSFAANDKLDQAKVTELRIALRDLWVDHVIWTRQYIVAAAADAPDTDFAAQRLLKNQEDIGNAIKPFYGDEAGDELTSLLKDHILIAVDLLNAAKAGDSAGLEEAEEKWYDNADDIATFLSDANPNWPKEHMISMLDEHLSLTKGEAVARLTGDYSTDVVTFDEIHRQAMIMADGLADGIVKQFPEQFEVNRTVEGKN
ncbi:MAG TPA: hypothetical protein VGQ03_03480 [Nitrososphaera sp.]|jgi:hypothetical protein|nr:hypothetical protein [Nitrososphaera sp.]